MKLIISILLVLGGAYLFPQLYEEVDGPCQALEKKLVRDSVEKGFEDSVISNFALSLSNGEIGQRYAADQYPELPSRLACLAVYYNIPEEFGS